MTVKIFCCYAHEDELLLDRLKRQLKPLQRQALIEILHDRDISAGAEWEQEIKKYLNDAQIILLLISPDFMASDYCYSVEMAQALERHKRGEAYVIPVILRPVSWMDVLRNLQALPINAKPVMSRSWYSVDDAFLDIEKGLRKVIENISQLKSSFSRKVLNIPLLAESLEVDSNQLKKNLQDLYGCDVKGLRVDIDMYDLGANLIEVVEKICRGIESSEISISADICPLLLKQIRNRSEHWQICFPAYEANLATLLSKLVEEVFSSYNNPLHFLTIVRESIENTLAYTHYQLAVYLQRAVASDLARRFGFPAIAAYLEKYEGYGSDQESIKKVLNELYKYQDISVNSFEQIYLVASKSKSAGSWRVYFPNLTKDVRMEIMINCQTRSVIDGYSWHVFFLPQVIGNAIMEISFGEGKRIDELTYKVGLNLKNYECVGLP